MDESAFLARLFARGEVALCVWSQAPGWVVHWVSDSVADLLGYAPEDLLAGRLHYRDLIHPECFDRVAGELRASVEAGEESCAHSPYRLRRVDGSWIWVFDRTVIDRDDAGRAIRYETYLIDVSENIRAREALDEQRRRMELVFEAAEIGYWDWNPQTGDVAFNGQWCRMLGYDVDELVPNDESWRRLVHPEDMPACEEAIRRHEGGESALYEAVFRMRHKDGSWRHILARGRILERDAQGLPVRFAGTHVDISARREAELRAEEATRAKSLFLAKMSHEIRTPLNGVLGLIQLLEQTELDENQRETLEMIRESGDGLLEIVNAILDLSKIEAGRLELDPHPFEVRRLLRGVHDLYRETALTKGLDYQLSIDETVPARLVGDSHRVRQVLMNLISNAIKFTEGGEVTLRSRAEILGDGDRCRWILEVRDTGKGIEDASEIFEAFQQEERSISRSYGGTGLGLAIVRQLVDAMEGEVDVASAPGRGSTFTVRLPLEIDLGTEGTSLEQNRPAAKAGPIPDLRVLVAEDNAVNQRVIDGILRKLGQEPVLVGTGLAALEACLAQDFDLVFMDVHMPEMDGLEASRRIERSVPPERRPRIVILSADVFAPDDARFAETGVAGTLTKPFKMAQIERVLRETAEAAPARERPLTPAV